MEKTNPSLETKMCMYPNFAQIFGSPMEGIHKYRIFGVAAFDLFATLLLAYLITIYMPKKYSKNKLLLFILIFGILMAVGVVLHAIFCVPTPLTKKVLGEIDRL
jgi:hypothetical protein